MESSDSTNGAIEAGKEQVPVPSIAPMTEPASTPLPAPTAATVLPLPSYDGSSKAPKRKPGRPSNAELAARKAAQKTEAELKAQAKEGDLDEIMDQARRRIKQALPNATAQQAATVYGIIYDKRFKNTNGATADLQLTVKDEDRDVVLKALLGRQGEREQSAPTSIETPKASTLKHLETALASDTTP